MANCKVSDGWDFSDPANHNDPLLLASPYTWGETTMITCTVLACTVGLVANLFELYILFQQPSKWNKFGSGAYLTSLAIADGSYCLFILFYLINPWLHSDVSYNGSFHYCGMLIGCMLIADMANAGFISLIALETSNKWSFQSKPLAIGAIALAAIICVHFAVPTSVFTDDTTTCVGWPETEEYKNFPNEITLCPWLHFLTFRFVLFHDVPMYFLTGAILIYCYKDLISADSRPRDNMPYLPPANNLKARIACLLLSHLLVRMLNSSGAVVVNFTGITLPEYTPASEFGIHIVRGTMWIPPVLNPFIYFIFPYRQTVNNKEKV